MSRPSDLIQGTLDSSHPEDGLARAQARVGDRQTDPAGEPRCAPGQPGVALPRTARLEHQGWLKAQDAVTETGREARLYTLTAAGRKQLAKEVENSKRPSTGHWPGRKESN